MGITIPRRACPVCQREGIQLFAEAQKFNYKQIYLQDLSKDQYYTGS